MAKSLEIPPAGGSGVHHRGDAGPEAESVGQDTVVAGPGVAQTGGGEQVDVDVDEAGRHIQAADVDRLLRLRGVDRGPEGGNLAATNGHVHAPVDVVPGIDDVAALEEQLILLSTRGSGQQ